MNVSRIKLWVPQHWVVFTLKCLQRKLCPIYRALEWITEAGIPGELFLSPLCFFFPLTLPQVTPLWKLCSLGWAVHGEGTQHHESRSGRGSRGTGNMQRAGSFFTNRCSESQRSRMDALSWVRCCRTYLREQELSSDYRGMCRHFWQDLKQACGD